MADWSSTSLRQHVVVTPAYCYNNLTSNQGSTVAFTNHHSLLLVDLSESKDSGELIRPQISKGCKITQVAFLPLGDEVCLGIASTEGFQLWNARGDKMLGFLALAGEYQDSQVYFCKGICSVKANSQIFAGSSAGDIFVLTLAGGKMSKTKKLAAQDRPISALAASRQYLVSAGLGGTVSVRKNDEDFTKIKTFQGKNDMCATSMVLLDDTIVVGFSSGQLRVYSIEREALVAEVDAHAKCVTALSCLNSRVVSTGKDSFVNVWAIPAFTKESDEIELVFSKNCPDQLLTGACFLNNGDLVTSAYDLDSLNVYNLM